MLPHYLFDWVCNHDQVMLWWFYCKQFFLQHNVMLSFPKINTNVKLLFLVKLKVGACYKTVKLATCTYTCLGLFFSSSRLLVWLIGVFCFSFKYRLARWFLFVYCLYWWSWVFNFNKINHILNHKSCVYCFTKCS